MIRPLFILLILLGCESYAETQARWVLCQPGKSENIYLPLNKVSVLSFDSKPLEVLPGRDVLDIKFLRNDLAIKPKAKNIKTNLFVYLKKTRCAFEVIATNKKRADEIVYVSSIPKKIKNKKQRKWWLFGKRKEKK